MKSIFWAGVAIIIGLLLCTQAFAAADLNDVAVWQGQYFIGNVFQKGTFDFDFNVYDAAEGGSRCFSSSETLTTGNWGEWSTEQQGVSYTCDEASKSYFLEISINGVKQLPRRRLTVLHFLRADVNDQTIGSITAPYIKATQGIKEISESVWQTKLSFAAELAEEMIAAQEDLALAHIATAKAISDITVGESIDLKRLRIIAASELALDVIATNASIAKEKVFETRELMKLNGETPEDIAFIEEDAQAKAEALEVLANEKAGVVDLALDVALAGLVDDGKRFCLSDGTNCPPTGNVWGLITGTLSNQTDLATALASKVNNTALAVWPGSTNITTLGTINNARVTSLTIDGGAAITNFLSVSQANVVSESIPNRVCGNYAKIEVRGAKPGNAVTVAPRPDISGIETVNLSWSAYVADTDTVIIRACNPTARAIDTPNTQTWVVDVWAP
ncbi:MAG: hypothetical protein WCW31_04350 [Patescibacteria group bacterium]